MVSAGVAYFILTHTLIASHGRDSALAKAVGRDVKGLASVGLVTMLVLTLRTLQRARAGRGHPT